MSAKTWFVTGASRGLGWQWINAALDRGDNVAAAARSVENLAGLHESHGDRLLPLALDVTDRAAVFTAVDAAHRHFGRLDVVVNNAGFGVVGAIEELTEDEARAQFETNLFGTLWVTQAALPLLRAQTAGHIIQVSSVGGLLGIAGLGIYNASKWAVEGLSQALAREAREFGISVTIVEPSGYATDAEASSRRTTPIAAYQRQRDIRDANAAAVLGDPVATREAMLAIVDADEPPLRIFFAAGMADIMAAEYEARLATWREWQAVSTAAFRQSAGSTPAGL
jgi:NAD(P)-dependent dehydrogenase (short-subunit alcohol dehydrogenase family)